VFLAAGEVDTWSAGALEGLARRARRVVITRGRDGADIYTAAGIEHIPARPAQRVDPTGAGDVFATAFILAVRAGEQRAGAIASAYAAAAVERQGPAQLPPLQEIVASLDQSSAQQR
jgi:sugar/nucleoside kinase (ribokinase family)